MASRRITYHREWQKAPQHKEVQYAKRKAEAISNARHIVVTLCFIAHYQGLASLGLGTIIAKIPVRQLLMPVIL
jgi:hypothetical protein